MRTRLQFSQGFRGATGVHYAGGYKKDGLLREENFDKVAAAVSGQSNLKKVDPETMDSIELAYSWEPTEASSLEAVYFRNSIKNIIGTGAFCADSLADCSLADAPNIGTDVPGTWNGYWYFQNLDGKLQESGLELSFKYQGDSWILNTSHSMVQVDSVDKTGSNYVTSDKKVRAYPENVTRLGFSYNIGSVTAALNMLWYHEWNTPQNTKIDGNQIVNLAILYKITDKAELMGVVRNLTNAKKLYPMNLNPGDSGTATTVGSPAIESATGYVSFKYAL